MGKRSGESMQRMDNEPSNTQNQSNRYQQDRNTCNYCKKQGHWKLECRKRIRDEQRKAQNNTENGQTNSNRSDGNQGNN